MKPNHLGFVQIDVLFSRNIFKWKKLLFQIYSYREKIRQINSLVISLVNRYYHEIFVKKEWEQISVISTLWAAHSVEIAEILFHTFSAKVSWKH